MSLWDDAEKRMAAPDSTPTKDGQDVDLDVLDNDNLDTEDDLELDDEEEEEEEVEETDTEKKVPVEEKKADDTGLTPEQQVAVQADVLKYVDGNTILKVKGVERKASDLSPKEMVVYLQKGMNADRLFQEHAASKRELEHQRAIVEQSAAAIQEEFRKHQAGQAGGLAAQGKGLGLVTTLPDYLKPSADDTPEVQQWKESQVQMLDEHNAMKMYISGTAQRETDLKKVNEVVALRETYPMASVDEVLAVKSIRQDIDSEELMRASHNYYSGGVFLKKAMEANPTFKREYDASVIKGYMAKKGSAPKIPGKRVRNANVDKVSFGEKRKNTLRTFEDADLLSRQYARELNRMDKES